MGKVENWLVEDAKKTGLNIEGFEHEITRKFMTHVLDEHGDTKKEAARGQIAINVKDFEKILDIIQSPDYVLFGGKYTKGDTKGNDFIVYAKEMTDGTTLYYEAVLPGKRNKKLRGKTMYKRKNIMDKQKFLNIVSNTDGVDVSNAEIFKK